MRKSILTLVFVVLLAISPAGGQVQLDSVVKLNGVTPSNPEASCTAFAIGVRKWITSTHCLSGIEKRNPTIDGDPIFVIDERLGASSMSTMKVTGLPLTLSKHSPKEGDPIRVKGFPFGFPKSITTAGVVGTPLMLVPERESLGERLIVNALGAQGSSGSPIFDENGEVIGVVESGWGREMSPLLAATPWAALKDLW